MMMTMSNARRTMSAATFKAQCLAVLDRVAESGEILVVTKRGRPVARVVPIEKAPRRSLRGSVRYHGDIVAPIDVKWDAEQ
jgi:prevent-host-death family protein